MQRRDNLCWMMCLLAPLIMAQEYISPFFFVNFTDDNGTHCRDYGLADTSDPAYLLKTEINDWANDFCVNAEINPSDNLVGDWSWDLDIYWKNDDHPTFAGGTDPAFEYVLPNNMRIFEDFYLSGMFDGVIVTEDANGDPVATPLRLLWWMQFTREKHEGLIYLNGHDFSLADPGETFEIPMGWLTCNNDDDNDNGNPDHADLGKVDNENDLSPFRVSLGVCCGLALETLKDSDLSIRPDTGHRMRLRDAGTGVAITQPVIIPLKDFYDESSEQYGWPFFYTGYQSVLTRDYHVEGIKPSDKENDAILKVSIREGNQDHYALDHTYTVARLDLCGSWTGEAELTQLDERCKKHHLNGFYYFVEHGENVKRSVIHLRYWGPTTSQDCSLTLEVTGGEFLMEGQKHDSMQWREPGLDALKDKPSKFTPLMPPDRDDVTYTARLVKYPGTPFEQEFWCDTFTIVSMPRVLIPDLTHDGVIDDVDRDWARHTNTVFKTWRIWLNDDLLEGDAAVLRGLTKHRGKSKGGNGQDDEVNGAKDCLNFFPLQLELSNLWLSVPEFLQPLPSQVAFESEGAGLKALLNQNSLTTAANAGALHRDIPFVKSNHNATSTPLTKKGVFPPALATHMRNTGKDVIYVEGSEKGAGTLAMRLIIGNWKRAYVENTVPVQVSDVEEFYLHTSLRTEAGGNAGKFPTRADTPALPDALCNNIVSFWVHGYNTSAEEGAAWHARMFKSMHQSGSFARHHGVSWYGDQGKILFYPPDYHQNVKNAFKTAPALARLLIAARAGPYTTVNVSAHSLGNMVVSSAIKDHGARADLYNSLNSAVASEAYDAGRHNTSLLINGGPNVMIPSEWRDQHIPSRAFAARWHSLSWPAGDLRANAAWAGRFAGLAGIMHNYAAPYEEVLEVEPSGDLSAIWDGINLFSGFTGRHYAWHKQELYKGRPTPIVGPAVASDKMGWGFEWTLGEVTHEPFDVAWTGNPPLCHITLPDLWSFTFRPITPGDQITINRIPHPLRDYQGEYELWIADLNYLVPAFLLCKPGEQIAWRATWPAYTREGAAAATDDELRHHPVFLKKPAEYFEAVLPPGITQAGINDRLADGIPALSWATGVVLNGPFEKTFNLEAGAPDNRLYKANDADWPRSATSIKVFGKRWMHADLMNMAYPFVSKFWMELIAQGGFSANPAP